MTTEATRSRTRRSTEKAKPEGDGSKQIEQLDTETVEQLKGVPKALDALQSQMTQISDIVHRRRPGSSEETKIAAREGTIEAGEQVVRTAKQKAIGFAKHFVPTSGKEVGQLVMGFGLGFVTGGRVATSDWMENNF